MVTSAWERTGVRVRVVGHPLLAARDPRPGPARTRTARPGPRVRAVLELARACAWSRVLGG